MTKDKFPEDDFDDHDFDEHDDDEEKFEKMPKDEIFYTEDEYNDLLDENIELKKDGIFIAQKELNERVLNDAIIVCSKSIGWYFKSLKSKAKEIKSTYIKFMEMVEDDIDPINI